MRRIRIVGLVLLVASLPGCRYRARPSGVREAPPARVPRAPAGDAPTAVPMPAVSGLAPVDAGHYLVVHDAKAVAQPAWPRVGILTLNEAGKHVRLAYEPVAVAWGTESPSNDLEAACAVPGRAGQFLLAESRKVAAAGGTAYGRVFHVQLSGGDGGWCLAVLGVGDLPAFPSPRDVEGMACLARRDGSLLLFLGERDSAASDKASRAGPGTLHWGRIDLGSSRLSLRFDPEDRRPLDVKYDDGTSPVRTCSDLFVDASGTLWGAACDDPDDDRGPFRSAVYRIGPVSDAGSPVGTGSPQVVRTLDGMKVEAVSAGYRPGELSVATDDEDYGGCWRRLSLP